MKKDVALSILIAFLITFSFPPFQAGFLAFGALIPLFLLIQNKSRKEAFRWSYMVGLLTNLMLLYWIGWSTLAGAFAAILVLPLYLSLFSIIQVTFLKKWGENAIYIAPILWTAIEWIKSLGEIGFSWFTIGYSQSYYLPLIQFASFTGIYGVSFWVVLLNVILFNFYKNSSHPRKRLTNFAIVIFLVGIPYLHGKFTIPDKIASDSQTIRVAVVQGSIDPFKKWKFEYKDSSFVVYEKLTRLAARENPDLIVWPETATPCWLKHEYEYLNRIVMLVDSLNIPLLTGTPDYQYISEMTYRTYNAAILIAPKNPAITTYWKMRLVPFGERVPFEDSFPFTLITKFLNKLEMGQGNFSPGVEPIVFSILPKSKQKLLKVFSPAEEEILNELAELLEKTENADSSKNESDSLLSKVKTTVQNDSIRFSVAICYESIFPDIVQTFVRKGAQFLLVITNDAWFGRTSMPFQHNQYAVFRAIENRVSIARCSNAGISSFINPYGQMTKVSTLLKPEALIDNLPILKEKSFYAHHGNIFANAMLIVSFILLFMLRFVPARKH
ncbi:apolipoprotein N-acyltransferase [candidate division KSB1 bacterium]|nr:apolipoprotein N-acyltransferase [candidate division KSB1 bacterium]